jgi:hypothetical protein
MSSRGPGVRQQGIEVLNGMCCDARKNIAEPRERINLHQFAGRYKAPQDGHGLAATIAAQEDPVVPTYCDTTQQALRVIVVKCPRSPFSMRGSLLSR